MVLFFRDMHYLGVFLCSCDEIVVTAVAGIIAGTFITSCSFIISLCPRWSFHSAQPSTFTFLFVGVQINELSYIALLKCIFWLGTRLRICW